MSPGEIVVIVVVLAAIVLAVTRSRRRTPAWQDRWVVETFEATEVSQRARDEGLTGHWGCRIAFRDWAQASPSEQRRLHSEYARRLGKHFVVSAEPERVIYSSLLGNLERPGMVWWSTEAEARARRRAGGEPVAAGGAGTDPDGCLRAASLIH